MSQLETFVTGGSFFECPRWHDGAWWASDFYRQAVHRYDADGEEQLVLDVPGQPSGLGWLPDGDLLVVAMKEHRILRVPAGGGPATTHADLTDLAAGHLNDMVVTDSGRAYVGCFGFDLMGGADPVPAPLLCVEPDGTARQAADGLLFPNGTVLTDDGTTLIVAETFGSQLTAFTVDPQTGELSDRRTWAQPAPPAPVSDIPTMLGQITFAPDGIGLDAEGCVWVANALGDAVMRISEGGALEEQLALPEGLHAYAVMLGGPDGKQLVACAAPDFLEHNRKDVREGVLLTTQVAVGTAGRP